MTDYKRNNNPVAFFLGIFAFLLLKGTDALDPNPTLAESIQELIQESDLPSQSPKSYVRDGPLHEKLMEDTWKALEKFNATLEKTTKKQKQLYQLYRPRYFEGWYYKLDLPSDEDTGEDGGTFVVIPGVYLRPEDQHGFVMTLDATKGADPPVCRLYRFPIEQVSAEAKGDRDFRFEVGDSVFTARGFKLNLPADETNPPVAGSATWQAPLPLPATLLNPTIMGWFSWLPRGFMQCSHGVVSVDHSVAYGSVVIGTLGSDDSKTIDLAGARGYVEKDWGREFPEKYTWIQANDFVATTNSTGQNNGSGNRAAAEEEALGASFMVSVASIPLKPFAERMQFTGFLSFLRYPDRDTGNFRTLRLATYTGARASYEYRITNHGNSSNYHGPREHTVTVELTDQKYRLVATVTGDRDTAATLWGPLPNHPSGGMRPYVREMLNCPVELKLTRRKDERVLFEGVARHGGFEIEGHHDDDDEASATE